MATITKPYTFATGNLILASQFNETFDQIYAEFNGNIDNANIKASAGILGSKIANAPSGIGTSQINDNAVTSTKLASDAVTDSARAVTTDHIRDKNVTGAKIPNDPSIDADRALTGDHVKNDTLPLRTMKGFTYEEINFDVSGLSTLSWTIALLGIVRKVSGANYIFRVNAMGFNIGPGYAMFGNGVDVTPASAIPTATKKVLAAYIADAVYNSPAGHITGKLCVISADLN